MAIVFVDDQCREVDDNASIQQACEDMNVPFGCCDGLCGSCEVEVIEGMENLTEETQEEKDMALPPNHRLACQCRIKSGVVKFHYDE